MVKTIKYGCYAGCGGERSYNDYLCPQCRADDKEKRSENFAGKQKCYRSGSVKSEAEK